MTRRFDTIIIGANVGGLTAAAYLARAGARVLLLEENAAPREPFGALHALDPQMVSDLRLASRELAFRQRDLPLIWHGETALTLSRDMHAMTRLLRGVSDADAQAWAPLRRAFLAQARHLRRWWWSGLHDGKAEWMLENPRRRDDFARLCLTGADAFLGARFENDGLIAAQLWDATAGGFAVSEPGAAAALMWRAAQEMAGLQGAVALPVPGTLIAALRDAASGAQLRGYSRVRRILSKDRRVAGVMLDDGEEIAAETVLSGLTRDATLDLLGLTQTPPRIAEAQILLTLDEDLALPPGRHVIAERAEIFADAHEDARRGVLPVEQPLEFVALAPGRLAVTLRPVPASPPPGWKSRLSAQAIFAMARHLPGLGRAVRGVECHLVPRRASLVHLLAPAGTRLATPLDGLYLCGEDAEPVACVSGRAARIAAGFALTSQK